MAEADEMVYSQQSSVLQSTVCSQSLKTVDLIMSHIFFNRIAAVASAIRSPPGSDKTALRPASHRTAEAVARVAGAAPPRSRKIMRQDKDCGLLTVRLETETN